jgi:hypothetical protein
MDSTAANRPDGAPLPAVGARPALGAHRQPPLAEQMAGEAQAWIAGESALRLAESAIVGWYWGEFDRGTMLAMLTTAGSRADRAMLRLWPWLAARAGDEAA